MKRKKKEHSIKILDHKWNQLRVWVKCCEDNFTPDGLMRIQKMREMMDFLDNLEKKIDEVFINALCKPEQSPEGAG